MRPLCLCRQSFVRLSRQGLKHNATTRGLHNGNPMLAAHAFTMPAMSPTMTEGNISSWKVKEGEAFSAGDVLLEIETDKASMDVEASDDGVMAKILQPDGSKGLKVGSRIAVVAETGDDIQSIEIPVDDYTAKPIPEADSTASPKPNDNIRAEDKPLPPHTPEGSARPRKQHYPLYPSVSQLFHENGIDASEADKIPASGPNGRLLKGDVLAYVGTVDKSYPAEQATRIASLGHLDLSNIKIRQMEPTKPNRQPEIKAIAGSGDQLEKDIKPTTNVTVTISLRAVQDVQARVQKVLGTEISLETFISRAIDLSNTDLPRLSKEQPTSDELFDDILGLRHVHSRTVQGRFMPQIMALPAASQFPRASSTKSLDIIEVLTSKQRLADTPRRASTDPGVRSDGQNIFYVTADKNEEKRARIFLERLKTVLQVDPGKLVL